LTRIHLEEDTARSAHGEASSLVDFNRAGVPLMELVTEPVIHSARQAVEFGMELQRLLQYLHIGEANMEKGEMRFEANISVSLDEKFGTKVEVKNLNSFRSAEKAIEYEIERQIEVLERGEKVEQETRGWDERLSETFSQRSKEDSHDYRYFPDPDLPKLNLSKVKDFNVDSIQSTIPETPAQKRERFVRDYSIKQSDIDFYISNKALSDMFEKAAFFLGDKQAFQLLSNYIVSDIASLKNQGLSIIPEYLSELVKMLVAGEISSRTGKNILAKMPTSNLSPRMIAEKENLMQKHNKEELIEIAKKVVEENKLVVAEFKNGKVAALQYLVGQAMKLSQGTANPTAVKSLFEKMLLK
jgi:aspartyl-tRNA(Asn)/glutamyl-tRNA(Gln) amidotransferase subunit B